MNKTISWAARGFAILFVLFTAMFALDVSPFSWLALLMHLLPTFILLALLLVSWKKAKIGAMLWILAGLAYIVMAWGDVHWSAYLAIAGPAIVVGVLFWFSDKGLKKTMPSIEPASMKTSQNIDKNQI